MIPLTSYLAAAVDRCHTQQATCLVHQRVMNTIFPLCHGIRGKNSLRQAKTVGKGKSAFGDTVILDLVRESAPLLGKID